MIKTGKPSLIEVAGLITMGKKGQIGGGWILKLEEENDDPGDDESSYKVYSLKNGGESPTYWKLTGWHDSYEGDFHLDYSTIIEVTPREVKATNWTPVK